MPIDRLMRRDCRAAYWPIRRCHCYLQDLYVSDTLRGQGIGRLLIEAVYDEADKRGVPTVYWLTQDFNKPARLLYDKIATLTPFIKYNR